MMEESKHVIDDELKLSQLSKEGPPTFLKVLCILTYVGSGLALFSSTFGLLNSAAQEESLRMMENVQRNLPDGMGPFQGLMQEFFDINVEEVIKWTFYSNIAILIGAVLCLIGAIMMWKRRIQGYGLYIADCVITGVVGWVAMSHMFQGPIGTFARSGVIFGSIFSVAFIVMYGANLRHMRPPTGATF